MKTSVPFDVYFKRFLTEHIKGLPKSFDSINQYRDTCMLLFNGWQLLKMFPEYSSPKFKKLEDLLNKIDQFDNTLERSLEMKAIKSIGQNPNWKAIHKEVEILGFS